VHGSLSEKLLVLYSTSPPEEEIFVNASIILLKQKGYKFHKEKYKNQERFRSSKNKLDQLS